MATALAVTAGDLDVATRTAYGEARGEPALGVAAVLWVIRNRAAWSPPQWWGASVSGVCQHASQFSCWNADDPNRARLLALLSTEPEYQAMRAVARAVLAGEIDDPTAGSTHYERLGAGAAWARGRAIKRIVGNHAFFVIGPS